MFDKLRDILLYLYEASEKMEEKSTIFAEQRKERMGEFKKHKEELHAKAKEKIKEMKTETKEKTQQQLDELLKKAGVARKSEIDELKKMIADLATKVDKLK